MMRLTRLANGLRVASRDMPGFETIAVGLYADAGSRHEQKGVNGIAHLFEHMVFKGAGGRSAREISETIEDVGGDLNAATDRDSTNFAATMLAEHMPLGVELLADLILNPHLDPQELEREKDVVLQELAEARDTPGDIIFDELWSAAFASQPLGRSVLGDETSLARITAVDLIAWRNEHFRADNLCLVAAGKVDHGALVEEADRRLGRLLGGTPAACASATFTGERRTLRGRSDQAHLTVAFAGPSATSLDYPAARLFADILGGGASSRLFQAVREERGLAYSVSASAYGYADVGIMSVHAATSARNAQAAGQLIAELIEHTATDLTDKELQRAKTQARAGLLMSLESTWGQANFVARQVSLHDRLVEPAEVLETSAHVTVEQARAVAQAMVSGPRASASIGSPAVRAA
jgi:predicted Zn-dependent peptidase